MTDNRKRTLYHDAQTPIEYETPTLRDIGVEDTQRFGEIIRDLRVGDVVKVTNDNLDFYIKGEVEETWTNDGDPFAIVRFSRQRAELHANWSGIPPDSDDQETPYTGLLLEPFDDTAPEVTDIEVVEPAGGGTSC